MVAPVLRSRLLSGSTTRESVPLKTPEQLQHKCTIKLIISTSNRIVLSHKHSDILITIPYLPAMKDGMIK